ncbi:MAG: hypothetical protein ABI859_03260 [Pseudomonadota bacterium]
MHDQEKSAYNPRNSDTSKSNTDMSANVADPRAEQVFFDDPAVDRLMGVVMALASETYVLKDRLNVLERQLAASGHVDTRKLVAAPDSKAEAADYEEAAEFTRTLLEPLLGLQKSLGIGGKFSLNRRQSTE